MQTAALPNREKRRETFKNRCSRKKITSTGMIMSGIETLGKTDARKTRDKRKRTRLARLSASLSGTKENN